MDTQTHMMKNTYCCSRLWPPAHPLLHIPLWPVETDRVTVKWWVFTTGSFYDQTGRKLQQHRRRNHTIHLHVLRPHYISGHRCYFKKERREGEPVWWLWLPLSRWSWRTSSPGWWSGRRPGTGWRRCSRSPTCCSCRLTGRSSAPLPPGCRKPPRGSLPPASGTGTTPQLMFRLRFKRKSIHLPLSSDSSTTHLLFMSR